MEGKAAGEYMRGYTSMIRREPVGVAGQIAPWNYPLMMAVWKIGPALAAGNTVVLKPLRTDASDGFEDGRAGRRHLPGGVLNVITGDGEPVGAGIVRHPKVDMVSLTGDVATGKEVARAAAQTLKRVHLELGGKAPVIVFDDADIEAVENCATRATPTRVRTARRPPASSPGPEPMTGSPGWRARSLRLRLPTRRRESTSRWVRSSPLSIRNASWDSWNVRRREAT